MAVRPFHSAPRRSAEAYKDIEVVMERQSDLCRQMCRLEALVTYKGT